MQRPRAVIVTAVPSTMRAFLQERIDAMLQQGYDLTLVSSPGADLDLMAAKGARCIAVNIPRSVRPLKLITAWWKLLRLFRQTSADIVHTHTPIAAFLGQTAAWFAGVPARINTVHGLYFINVRGLVRRWLFKNLELIACRLSTHIICDSGEDVPYLRKQLSLPSDRISEINVGVNLSMISPEAAGADARNAVRDEFDIPPNAIVFGTIARMVREKGLVELFEAFDNVARRHENVFLLHVGPADNSRDDGLTQEELARGAAKDRCRFTGQRYDIARMLAAMDVLVLPSHREGFPVSVMEAAAMGLPSITTDIRGCREAVVDGETGIVVPHRQAQPIADAMERLLADPQLRQRMGAQALKKATTTFNRESVVQRTLDIYRQALRSEVAQRPHRVKSP